MFSRSRPTAVLIGPLIYRCFVLIISLLAQRGKARPILEAEVIALRHQVKNLRRQVDRVEFSDVDRPGSLLSPERSPAPAPGVLGSSSLQTLGCCGDFGQRIRLVSYAAVADFW